MSIRKYEHLRYLWIKKWRKKKQAVLYTMQWVNYFAEESTVDEYILLDKLHSVFCWVKDPWISLNGFTSGRESNWMAVWKLGRWTGHKGAAWSCLGRRGIVLLLSWMLYELYIFDKNCRTILERMNFIIWIHNDNFLEFIILIINTLLQNLDFGEPWMSLLDENI